MGKRNFGEKMKKNEKHQPMDDPEYFECTCTDCGHVIRYIYDPQVNEIHTEIQLVSLGFWSRVWHAFKYVFKLNCKYGAWDNTILNGKDVPRLIKLLEKVEKNEVSDRTD